MQPDSTSKQHEQEVLMDIGRSFTYMFEDQDWLKKILIGGVVNLIPIVNFASTGYFIEAIRNTAEGRELPLPEWDDFGGKFMKGLMAAIAGFIYALPIMLFMGIVFGLTAAVAAAVADEDTAAAVVTACSGIGYCLTFVYMILFTLIFPAAVIRYALTGQFGAFFRFGDIIAFIKANIGGYIIALLVALVASLIAQIVGGIACGIGILFTLMWAYLVGANLFGNLVREAQPATY
jgi:hypothetical protein